VQQFMKSTLLLLFLYFSFTNAEWRVTSLSEARGEIAITSLGDFVLFAGGRTPEGISNKVDIYNATGNSWSTTTLSSRAYSRGATSCGKWMMYLC
jgi:hypothetical protein